MQRNSIFKRCSKDCETNFDNTWRYFKGPEDRKNKFSERIGRLEFDETSETETSNYPTPTNLLLAPKQISKLIHSKKKETSRKGQGSDLSDADLSQEESFCNQELIMPNIATRKLTSCFEGDEYQKMNCNYDKGNVNRTKVRSVEERSIMRKTNISCQPTIVEHEIKVKDKRLRMSLPSLEDPNGPSILKSEPYKERGDSNFGDFSVIYFLLKLTNNEMMYLRANETALNVNLLVVFDKYPSSFLKRLIYKDVMQKCEMLWRDTGKGWTTKQYFQTVRHRLQATKYSNNFLIYPASAESLKIPKKRELHRLIHHRICNYMNPDIMLIIDEHEFFCHRIVLQCYSKYFDNMDNLSDENILTIKEKGLTKQAFIAIYAWMLSLNDSGLKYITRENFVEVLIASQVLQIRDLEEQCLALIDSKEVFAEGHAYQLFKQASKLEQDDLKELMVPRIQVFFLPFVSTQDFLDLPLEDLCTFLSSSYVVVHSEIEVFMSAARWLLEDWNSRKKFLPTVMNCVRFGLMNPLELVDIRKNPDSPEFLKITEDTTIQKYIDDGLAYSTYCTMKGESEDIKTRCQRFGLEIPQPRNWADTPKYYKSYGEFLSYLKQIRTNPLKIIEGQGQTQVAPTSDAAYSVAVEDSSFQLDFNSPLHAITDCIPSMSDLLSAGLRNKAKRERQRKMLRSNLNDDCSYGPQKRLESLYYKANVTDNKGQDQDQSTALSRRYSTRSVITPVRKEQSLRSKAATVIQAAFRGYMTRKKYNFQRRKKDIKAVNCRKKSGKVNGKSEITTKYDGSNSQNRLKQSYPDISDNKSIQVSSGTLLSTSQTVLVLGGLNLQQELSYNNDGRAVYRYSLDVNRWERVTYLPSGRYHHCAVFLKGKVYVLGGVDPKLEDQRQACISSDCWSFNPMNSEWFQETRLKTPRRNYGLVAYQGYLYAIGGQSHNDVILRTVEKYDPVRHTWEEVCPLPEPRLSPAVARFGGTIWVAGGIGGTSKNAISGQVFSYDNRQNMWINMPALKVGKVFSALVSFEDKLYLVGGIEKGRDGGSSASSSTIEVYDPKVNRWDNYCQMRSPRHSHTSLILDNSMYIIGGTTTQQMKSLNLVEVWSFESRSWKKQVSHLPADLTGHASVLLPSGT